MAVVVGHPCGGSIEAYFRWGFLVLLCFWAQSGHRVCPLIGFSGQSLHRPSSLRRLRFSQAFARLSSRFPSSVSWGLVGLVVDLRLAEPTRALRPGLAALRFRGRVLPALAGFGRMKVNSKVPPIAHVCWVRWHCCLLWLGVVLFLFNLLFLNGRGVGVNVSRCCGHLACCGQQKRAESLPPFWSLGPFFVASV